MSDPSQAEVDALTPDGLMDMCGWNYCGTWPQKRGGSGVDGEGFEAAVVAAARRRKGAVDADGLSPMPGHGPDKLRLPPGSTTMWHDPDQWQQDVYSDANIPQNPASPDARMRGGQETWRWYSALGLHGLATGLSARGNILEATYVWGAARMLRESTGALLPVNEQEMHEQEMYEQQFEQARAALGENNFTAALGENDFTAAWEKGRDMTWEQAVECALGE